MNLFYGIINIILITLSILFIFLNVSFNEEKIDYSFVNNIKVAEKQDIRKKENYSKEKLKSIWEKNIFSSYRGDVKAMPVVKKKETHGLRLIGLCSYGDVRGAIIEDKNRNKRNANGRKGKARQFYKINGKSLDNGYKLVKVIYAETPKESDSVILELGNKEIVLILDRTHISIKDKD